ncbi:hypothetical protein TOPH_05634 [Tolypocladium ophioglossoides CBS 100239]|uniref:Uncharacterized protein n=1 Tax=Tolypocladium ophioglossoides (strain CBS 100239) TaxID=1163406 RepID=A0A0L0N6J2_TOLOC|nr:hypothetical protein TOPH_05634 [Tolypocladium ophioglossoides CBS 100239]
MYPRRNESELHMLRLDVLGHLLGPCQRHVPPLPLHHHHRHRVRIPRHLPHPIPDLQRAPFRIPDQGPRLVLAQPRLHARPDEGILRRRVRRLGKVPPIQPVDEPVRRVDALLGLHELDHAVRGERVAHEAVEAQRQAEGLREGEHARLVDLLRGGVVEVLLVEVPFLLVGGRGEGGEELVGLEAQRECDAGG